MSWSNASDGAITDEGKKHARLRPGILHSRPPTANNFNLTGAQPLANGGHIVLLTLCDRKMGCPPLAIRTLIFAFPKMVSPTAFRDLPQKLRCLKNEITGVQR